LLDIWDSQYDGNHSEKQKDLLDLLFLPKDNKTLLEFSSGIPQEIDTSYYWFFEILKRSSEGLVTILQDIIHLKILIYISQKQSLKKKIAS
tara:strand:- start:1227 stop:1499 length:273 start_codon:yes stop_codon:yes gene_type:complete